MALIETKLRSSWIVLSAVFILLSVTVGAESTTTEQDVHRCYWCGPLADQVHRSQRTSSCNGDKSKTITCDEDLPYCAIVATSTPYVESRYCVKSYNEECYSLYCNTTKTTKMICPCKGELCNGANTKRENEAFEILLKNNKAKQVQKNRQKRVLSAGFISGRNMNRVNKTAEEGTVTTTPEVTEEIPKTDASEGTITTENSETAKGTYNENAETTAEQNTAAQTTKSETTAAQTTNIETTAAQTTNSETTAAQTTNSETTAAQTTNSENKETENLTTGTDAAKETTKTNDVTNPNIQIDIPSPNIDTGDLKTDIVVTSSEPPKLETDTSGSKIATTIETNPRTVEIKKSSLLLPESDHSENDKPTTIINEQMPTVVVTTMKTRINVSSLPATKSRNNTAIMIHTNILTLVIGIILQY